MIKYKILVSTILVVIFTIGANAQDTTAMLKEFNKVMSFAVQPYMHYLAYTKMQATPVLQVQDTLSMKGEFYKNETDLYYSNEQEEMYIQDSFFIKVDKNKKTIWISKVDVSTKDRMNLLPLKNKDLQALFRKKYTISKTVVDDNTEQLNFETKQYFDSISMVMMNVGLRYSGKNFLPQLLEMDVLMKQKLSDEQMTQMEMADAGAKNAVQRVGGDNYLMRTQKVTVTFEDVDNSKEKAVQIPSWKEKLNYNTVKNEFSGKGIYSDYEITKTF